MSHPPDGRSDRSITLSPVYPAAASYIGSERGLSIRFPRFMRLREDKGIEQATTAEQFADMYRKQMREAPARTAPGEVVIRQTSEDRDAAEGGRDEAEDGDEDEERDEDGDEDEDEVDVGGDEPDG